MKRFCFVLAVLIFVSSFVFAQTLSDKTVEWKLYEPPNEEFSVEFPASVSVRENKESNKDLPVLYSAPANKASLYITSGKESKSSVLEDILNLIKSEKAAEEKISINDFTAGKYSFVDTEDFFQTIVVAKGEKRFYIFHAISEIKDDPDINRFISSIKLNRQIVRTPDTQPPPKEPDVNVEERREISSGAGSGMGSGSGFGGGAMTTEPTPPNQISPLKILTKPKPSYTNLARYYSTQGTVRVRVTFLADGQIGSVTAIKKLPFGLTNSAINAAKQMRFAPPLRDGTPYTVTKLVEYSFTIY